MTLSMAMAEAPTEFEVTIFRKLITQLMTLQDQLNDTFHTYLFLRDRLMTANDIPHIQTTLRDRMPRSSPQDVNCMANQRRDKSQTAGSFSAGVVDCDTSQVDEAHSSLGKSFGVDARRPTKQPWNSKAPYSRTYTNNARRISRDWISGAKGYFVCGVDHRANTRQLRQEVATEMNELKKKHPEALLTVEDVGLVIVLMNNDPLTQHSPAIKRE